MDDIDAAWEAVHAALERRPGWGATRSQWHPVERLWPATAFYAGHLRRFDPRPAVEGRGTSEAEALWGLAAGVGEAVGARWRCPRQRAMRGPGQDARHSRAGHMRGTWPNNDCSDRPAENAIGRTA